MKRVLFLFAVVTSCFVTSYASETSRPKPIATLNLSNLLATQGETVSVSSIAFVSDTAIAVGLCQHWLSTNCSLSLIRHEDGVLRPYAQTSRYRTGMSLHPSSGGQILTTPVGMFPAVLLSADLTTAQDLPSLRLVSRSGNTAAERWGNTAAERKKGTWKIYRVLPEIELIRQGSKQLEDVSDEAVVLREGDMIRTETIDGKLLGSFYAGPRAKCSESVHFASNDTLYLADCKGARVVSFTGKEEQRLHPPKGWGDITWSSDGRRTLFNRFSRRISIFRNAGEIFVALATMGLGVGDELDNRQEVEVLDTFTGKSCFDWKRSFPENSESLKQGTAISPSGDFVAIAAGGTLAIYRLPAVCEIKK